jgi:hypothetical protein
MNSYHKYLWTYVMEELTGHIGRYDEIQLYEYECTELISNII